VHSKGGEKLKIALFALKIVGCAVLANENQTENSKMSRRTSARIA
jgi:hypothetical protein